MSRRPRVRDHPVRNLSTHRGQEAIYSSADPDTAPAPGASPTFTWDASHRRVTFYCPVGLVPELEAEMVRSGRSKTAVIIDALMAHLQLPPHRR